MHAEVVSIVSTRPSAADGRTGDSKLDTSGELYMANEDVHATGLSCACRVESCGEWR